MSKAQPREKLQLRSVQFLHMTELIFFFIKKCIQISRAGKSRKSPLTSERLRLIHLELSGACYNWRTLNINKTGP